VQAVIASALVCFDFLRLVRLGGERSKVAENGYFCAILGRETGSWQRKSNA
jgi:hypothetical protein